MAALSSAGIIIYWILFEFHSKAKCFAAGVIALLDENNPKLKSLALSKLDLIVNSFWHEIADVIQKIEKLYEDKNFRDYKLAAIVASKVPMYKLQTYLITQTKLYY